MYLVYLFREKSTGNVIYVGSSARPAERMKEHMRSLRGEANQTQIHKYILDKGLELYRDIEVVWCDYGKDKDEMIELEEKYYYKYEPTLHNDRPGENRYGWYNPKRRAVRCITDRKVYRTISECARHYGKGRTTLCRVLTGERDFTWVNGKKYKFEFVDNKV